MYCYSPTEKQALPPESLVGGKAYNLALMQASHFNVPSWFVITATAFEASVGTVLTGVPAEEMASAIEQVVLPEDVLQAIHQNVEALGLRNHLLAVRSSAIGEDGADHSFAGQLESFLYVRYEELVPTIKAVWQSAFSQRALFYRNTNGLGEKPVKVAVIVQEMVEADVSGVAFGIDPVSGNREAVTVASVFGLGEGLVSGLLEADTFTVLGEAVHAEIAHKTQWMGFNTEKGQSTQLLPLPEEKQAVASLNEAQLQAVVAKVKAISRHFGKPQDVEWAIANGTLYILQSRPVTTLGSLPDSSGVKVLWDNANIVESYAGVTTPLTFSFIQVVYTEVYKQFCEIMGVESSLIEENASVFQMLGLIQGRVYYNLLNWYKMLSLLPGYAINAAFMEQMMGVAEKLTIPPTVVVSQRNKYVRLATLVSKLVGNLFGLPKAIKQFYALLNETLTPYETTDLLLKKPDELVAGYFQLEAKLMKRWQAPLVNDFYAMIFYGVLKKLISQWQIDDKGTLQNDLLTGEGDIISTEPIKRIRALANQLCEDAVLHPLFLNEEEPTILSQLPQHPIYTQLQAYIHLFGNRCMGELKLETITYKENPLMLITLLKSYVKQGVVSLEHHHVREQKIRQEAEALVAQKLNNPLKKWVFQFVLGQTRMRVKNRENLRFERTRLFGTVRDIFLTLGKHFYAEGIIDHARDIFYLTKSEIFAYVDGTAVSVQLKPLIALRKAAFEQYASEETPPPADRFYTLGMVYHANAFKNANTSSITLEGDSMKGIGCCPGVVRARIKIVKHPNQAQALEGCIMVAERTDPGWVPLFPISQGILVERGSILSHSAIVAREMGIPAIVGIPNLLALVIDGELVEMDGATGVLRLLERQGEIIHAE